jgi:hypothetical protein
MSSSARTFDGKSALVQDRYIVSLAADEALSTVGQAVYLDYDWSVKATTGSDKAIFGVTLTKAASGAQVSVVTRGLVYGTAAGSISAGDILYAGVGTGRVQTATAANCATAGVPVRAQAVSSAAAAGSGVYFALF